jgi:hypothetical protein
MMRAHAAGIFPESYLWPRGVCRSLHPVELCSASSPGWSHEPSGLPDRAIRRDAVSGASRHTCERFGSLCRGPRGMCRGSAIPGSSGVSRHQVARRRCNMRPPCAVDGCTGDSAFRSISSACLRLDGRLRDAHAQPPVLCGVDNSSNTRMAWVALSGRSCASPAYSSSYTTLAAEGFAAPRRAERTR